MPQQGRAAGTFHFAKRLHGGARESGDGVFDFARSTALPLTDPGAMKIAQIAPLMEAVPPKLYGGSERVVASLTDELVALGHDVTLFASGDSVTDAKLEAVWPRALRLDETIRDPLAAHMLMLETVTERADEFDMIHLHVDYLGYSLMKRTGVPFVATLHGRLDLPELKPLYARFRDIPVVSISDAQRVHLPDANYIATIHHGLSERKLKVGSGSGGYLAFLGRISPEKAPDAAIRIAVKAGLPLKIAAKVDKVDRAYFAEHVEPLLGHAHIDFIGEIGEADKAEFLGNALALLFPIDWPEPFGLTMIEAMACGTPIIARRRGSVPEVIEDGVSGFIVDDEAQAVAATRRLARIDRARVRRAFEQRFTARRMAEDYLNIYHGLIARERPLRRVM
jgi:glycosyltransferase involved in cell wall biosynthesis